MRVHTYVRAHGAITENFRYFRYPLPPAPEPLLTRLATRSVHLCGMKPNREPVTLTAAVRAVVAPLPSGQAFHAAKVRDALRHHGHRVPSLAAVEVELVRADCQRIDGSHRWLAP